MIELFPGYPGYYNLKVVTSTSPEPRLLGRLGTSASLKGGDRNSNKQE